MRKMKVKDIQVVVKVNGKEVMVFKPQNIDIDSHFGTTYLKEKHSELNIPCMKISNNGTWDCTIHMSKQTKG